MANTKRPARQRIINALIDLLQERDYDDIPVKLLVCRAEVNNSTYYYNFHKIDDVADALMEQFYQSYRESFSMLRCGEMGLEERDKATTKTLRELVDYVYDNRRAFQAIVKSGKIEEFRRRYTQTIPDEMSLWEVRPFDADGETVELADERVEFLMYGVSHQYVAYLECWANGSFAMNNDEFFEMLLCLAQVRGTDLVNYRGPSS